MFKKILCPIDFSEFTKAQLDYARGFAEFHKAELSAMYVLPVPLGVYNLESWTQPDNSELDAQLKMKEYCSDDIQQLFGRGPGISDQIVNTAKQGAYDLILMPTHGLRGFEKILIGSVFQGVLLRSAVPVLALPKQIFERKVGFKAPSLILCPIDLQEGSGELVRFTEELAAVYGAAFTILHSIDLDQELLEMITLNTFTNFRSEVKSTIMKEFRSAMAAREVVVERGPAHEKIKSYTEQDSVGLVVLGFSHRSKLRIRTVLYRTVSALNIPALCFPVQTSA